MADCAAVYLTMRETRDIDLHRVGKGAADDTEGERLLAS
ncbi:hypothetical protein T261_2522 [Streptomyces lydicus]|nr:hypothetical protein T261_2522 [Streptomyces lydicus]